MIRPSLEGQTLGKYRILEPLGRGGMARVYRGYHPQLDRYVAVKVLRSDLVEDESFLSRFRREAQAVAGLRHPNIIQVHDFDVEDGIYFMVMELLDGDTLHTRLNDYRTRNEQMPWGEMVRILLDILDGLAYAHQEGMIHRDIKPANILLTRGGQAVLADFGIAQIVGGTQHTVSGALLGTLNYMAPEQGLEGISDIRTDLYSLGVVYYEMLTRNPPFHADTPLAILLKHVNDPLPLPRDENPEIPLSLERIVLKALAKEPDGRYQTAVAMSEALRAAATETEITLPKRISLPLSFATSVAPAESVAVFSGKDRAKLANADFAVQDTSATRLEEWEPNLEALKENERSTPRVASGQISHQPERGSAGQVAKTFLNSMGLIVAVNLLIVMFSGQSGPAWFFMRGWPVELFLAAGIFLQLMRVKRNLWLFIPGGILFWEGILLTYYALTGDWENWSFLWPLQVLLIVGVIFYTINRAAQRHQAGQLAASLGRRYRRYVIIATGILLFVVLVG